MNPLDELQNLPLDPSAAAGAFEQFQEALSGLPIPTELPTPGGDMGGAPSLPFGGKTQAALMESAAEGAQFLTVTVPGYLTGGAATLQGVAETYQMAFEDAAHLLWHDLFEDLPDVPALGAQLGAARSAVAACQGDRDVAGSDGRARQHIAARRGL